MLLSNHFFFHTSPLRLKGENAVNQRKLRRKNQQDEKRKTGQEGNEYSPGSEDLQILIIFVSAKFWASGFHATEFHFPFLSFKSDLLHHQAQ